MEWILLPLKILFCLSALMLILIVLVQSSRGSGLAGMMGGGGGGERSAFGTKTGTLMGKLTVGLAALFLVTALAYSLAMPKVGGGADDAPKQNDPIQQAPQDS